jgi:hypothetical protein
LSRSERDAGARSDIALTFGAPADAVEQQFESIDEQVAPNHAFLCWI